MSSSGSALLGVQEPRILVRPPARSSAGQEAVELARAAGLMLDPWQELVLDAALGEQPNGKWAAFEVGLNVPRQNGKGGTLEARELAGSVLFGEQLILHTAHLFPTAKESFLRLSALIENTPDLDRRVKKILSSNQEVAIHWKNGSRIRYMARAGGGGRGFTGDLVVFDEAMYLDAAAMGAMLPTLSSRPNPQVWYAGSAPLRTSSQWHAVRRRALSGSGGRLAYLEWSVDRPEDLAGDELRRWASDPELWALANPAMGIRITEEFIASELDAMPLDEFVRERLGVPDPEEVAGDEPVIDPDVWAERTAGGADPLREGSRRWLAVEVEVDRASAAIVAGCMIDGVVHTALVDHQRGSGWVPARVADLLDRFEVDGWGLDSYGAAGSLLPKFAELGLPEPVLLSSREAAQACGALLDAVEEQRIRVADVTAAPLLEAVRGGRARSLGDAWAWRRRDVSVAVAPLVALTQAHWFVLQAPEESESPLMAMIVGGS